MGPDDLMGPNYRRTRYGWEPVQEWKITPSPPSFQVELLRLIQETIDLGVPPRQAVKWWLYIAAELKKRREHDASRTENEGRQAGDA